jgi:aspartate/methionine/tyrosine aminotransferase
MIELRSYISRYVESIPQSGIREIFHEAMKYRDVIHLEIGDPDFTTPRAVVEEIYKAMLEGYTHYTHNAGLASLREAIAEYYAWKYGVAFDPESEVIVTIGGSGGLSLTLLATVDPDNEVLVPDPGYPSYVPMIMTARGKVARYKLPEDRGFEVDPESVISSITPKTKVIVINNPHNPTGSVTLNMNKLEEIVSYAHKRGIVVVADEVYESLVYDNVQFRSLAELSSYDNVVVVNSFSKTFAMTGLRLGFVLTKNKKLIEVMTRIQEGLVACAPAPVQAGVIYALKRYDEIVTPLLREFERRRDIAVTELKKVNNISFPYPRGAFYIFVNIKKYSSDSHNFAKKLLSAKKVAVAPGVTFGPSGEGYVRLSYTNTVNNIKEGIKRIREFLEEQSATRG